MKRKWKWIGHHSIKEKPLLKTDGSELEPRWTKENGQTKPKLTWRRPARLVRTVQVRESVDINP